MDWRAVIAIGLLFIGAALKWHITDDDASAPVEQTVDTSPIGQTPKSLDPIALNLRASNEANESDDPRLESLDLLWQGLTWEETAALVSATQTACDVVFGDHKRPDLDDDAVQELIDATFTELATSTDPAHQLTRFVMNRKTPQRFEQMTDTILSADQNDPYVLWHAVAACNTAASYDACRSAEQWVQRLTAIDADNSEAWAEAAGFYFNRSQPDKALDAMRQAISAPDTRHLYGPTIAAIAYGLNAATDLPDWQRAKEAFGFAGANQASMQHTRACQLNRALEDIEWIDVCERYFEMILERPSRELHRMIANDFLGRPHDGPGALGPVVDPMELAQSSDAETVGDLVETMKRSAPPSPRAEQLAFDTMIANETMMQIYLDQWSEFGDQDAVDWLHASIDAVLANDPELDVRCQ